MSTGNARDVSLVIKARDDATQAIESVTAAMNKLFAGQQQVAGSAKSTGVSLGEMAAIMAGVDKAVSTIAGAADKAEKSFASLSSSLTRRKQELGDYRRQAEEAAKAISILNGADSVVNSGRDQSGRVAAVRELQATYDSLQKKIAAVGKTITEEEARLQGSISSLQQLGSTAIGAAGQQEKLTKALKDRRDAVEAIAEAEQRASAARANVANLEARISPALTQRATDNGATTSALAAREEARFIRDAAAAHELFENRVKAGVRALKSEEAAARSDADAFGALNRELNPLVALEEKYAEKLRLVNKARTDGKITKEAEIELERKLAVEKKRATADLDTSGKAGITVFGLRPYELTNLSYQVNDVVTQLASGTSLSQTLAQQGGQILQLFPKVGSSIAAAFSNPYFLGAAVVFGTVAYAIKQAADEADRLRTISGNLDLNAAGKNYQAGALLESVNAMRALGATAEEAMKSVKTFTDEGLRAERIDQFGEAAVNMARVLGQDIPTSAKQMADAFTGGYESIVKLDAATNFLSAAQREHIRVLFEEGKAEEARTAALDIFTGKMDSVAEKQRGSWEKSTKSLTNSWENFKISLGNTDAAQAAYTALESLAKLLDRISGSSGNRTFADVTSDVKQAQSEIARLEGTMKSSAPSAMPWIRQRIGELRAEIAALAAEEARMKARGKGGVTTESDPNSQAAKARADKLRELSIEEELQALRAKGDKGLTQQEKQRREQLAGLQAIRGVEDAQVAAAQRRIAVEKEHTAILKEQERITKSAATDAKSAAAERERAITQFSGRVIGAEGGAGKNPNSSATGFGQFIDSTWLEQFKRVFAEQAKGMSNDQILALRSNQTIAKAIIDNYARENAKFLEKFGAKVTAGNLYLTHFLGAGDAKKVLQAPGDTPVDQLLSKGVMNANKGYLTTKGRARTADELEKFIAGRVGDTGNAQSAGQVEIAKLQQDQVDDQDKFNRSLEKGNEERLRSIEALRQQGTLQDSALIAAQRQVAIEKAEFDLKQRQADLNANRKDGQSEIVLTEAQIQKTRELAAAEFDLAHAREAASAKTSEIQRPLDQLTAERDALQARIDYLNSNGLYDQAASLVPDLTDTNSKLREAVDTAIEFYQALDLSNDALHRTPEEIRATIERLKTAKDETAQWVTVLGVGGKTIAQTFASSAVNAIDSFAQAIAGGANAFGALWASFRAFAANFLQQIAQMIQQQIIFNLISGLLKGIAGGAATGGGGGFGASNPFVSTSVAHTGGVVGSTIFQTRQAAPQWFANATRYHTGGIPGLAPDEVPIIAKNTEEIITASDPRHRNNGGAGGGAAAQDIKIINAFDAADMLSKALETKNGQRTILNFMSQNSRAVQTASGGN